MLNQNAKPGFEKKKREKNAKNSAFFTVNPQDGQHFTSGSINFMWTLPVQVLGMGPNSAEIPDTIPGHPQTKMSNRTMLQSTNVAAFNNPTVNCPW